MEVIKWKENKEVGAICFDVRIPMKKTKILFEFFYVSFWKKLFEFEFNNLILEKTKNIFGNTFIQYCLDLRKPDFKKNLDLRKIVATTDFLVHKLFDLGKIF